MALDGGVEELCAAGLGRGAVDVEQKLVVAVVDDLERRSGLDVDDIAGARVDALRWVAEVHGQPARDGEEGLLLVQVAVAPALGAGLVAPEVRAAVGEAGGVGHRACVARCLVRLVGTSYPLELVAADYVIGHWSSAGLLEDDDGDLSKPLGLL